ncbi:hypothetical protein ACEPAH_3139 [Sanghuangporus vaninii]
MVFTLEAVAHHNSSQIDRSCWLIIRNEVYDVTEFLSSHPGRVNIFLKYAGKDVTDAYDPIHHPSPIADSTPLVQHLGSLDAGSADAISQAKKEKKKTQDEIRVEVAQKGKPPLSRMLSVSHKARAFFWLTTGLARASHYCFRLFSSFMYMDGGVRHGAEALYLGVKAVGVGQPFLMYNVSFVVTRSLISRTNWHPNSAIKDLTLQACGNAGVERIIWILETEIILGMRLLHATKVEELVLEAVCPLEYGP